MDYKSVHEHMKYAKARAEVVAKIKADDGRILSAIALAKKTGVLEYYPIEMVKWSFPKEIDGKWIDDPGVGSDGHYDKEGLNSSDVHGYWDFKWWLPKNWKAFILSFGEYFKDSYEFVWSSVFKLRFDRFRENFNTWVIKYNPFRIRRSGWIWVADSIDASTRSQAWEEAEEIVAKKYGYPDHTEMVLHPREKPPLWRNDKIRAEIESISNTLLQTDRDGLLHRYCAGLEYVLVSAHMWVSKSDPTCFVFDEALVPFALKDGWDEDQLGLVVSAWIYTLFGVEFKTQMKRDEL